MDNKRLNQICGSFRTRLKGLLLQAGLARAVLLGIVLLAGFLSADWWVHLGRPTRAVLLLVYLGAVGAAVWWTLLVPLRKKWTDTEVLSYVDSVLPADQAMLLDLYELTQSPEQIQETQSATGKDLVAAAIAELGGLTERVQLSGTMKRGVAGRWLRYAGIAVAVLAIFAAIPATRVYLAVGATRLFNPFSTLRWPHRTTIDLANVPKAVPMLESQTIEGRVTGEVPDRVTLFLKSKSHGKYEPIPLSVGNNGFIGYKFERVSEPFAFYVKGGDYETDVYAVDLTEKPYIKKVIASYTFPIYAGIPNRTEESNQLRGLEGTEVKVRFECSMPLKQALLVPVIKKTPGEESPQSQPDLPKEDLKFTDSTNKTFERTFVLRDNCSYTIDLVEEHGFRQAKEERIDIMVDRDQPPKVKLISPNTDLVQTNKASVECAFEASDDFGLSKVEFIYTMDEGKEVLLTDQITGPIAQKGRKSGGRFTWPLRKTSIPDAGTLTCFVRVKDVNPLPGRGLTESTQAKIRLVKPTEFHLEVLEQSKGLLGETRLAWLAQLRAYNNGLSYLKKGTGAEGDPIWHDMLDRQDAAIKAARQMRVHLRKLTEQYERNQMAREFMAGRLKPISELINELIDVQHKAISEGLIAARPKTAADADMARLLALRQGELNKFKDPQKMSVLILERVLAQLYDWSDLQIATVTTTLMVEQQQEVTKKAEEIAPLFIGKEREDLSDQDLDKLMTLGKQQKAVHDTETGLENQFAGMLFRAQMLKRKSIYEPLWVAWKLLRDRRINDDLKKAAMMIENNQVADVLPDLQKVVRTLRFCEGGLVEAGKKVDTEPKLALTDPVQGEEEFDPELLAIKWEKEKAKQRGDEVIVVSTTRMDTEKGWEPPPPNTMLVAAIRNAAELQDNVLARVRYLAGNCTSVEMPRFVFLKLSMLVERQDLASKSGLDSAIDWADKAKADVVKGLLVSEREEFTQYEKLIAAKNIAPRHQQCQSDSISTLNDMLQLIARERAIEVSANEKKGGKDAFGRPYVFREKDLDAVVAMIARLNHAVVLQADIDRKLARFASTQPAEGLMAEFEKTNRARAAAGQKTVAGLIDATVAVAGAMSTEVAPRVAQTGAPGLANLKLASYVQPIAEGKLTERQLTELQASERSILSALLSLREALDEFVRPPPPPPPPPPKATTQGDIDRENSAKTLTAGLERSGLSPEMIARMRRQLSQLDKKFPTQYRSLLTAYYRSFIPEDKPPE
ncbi:MAG: hypothetical protein PHU85_00715 [Phycisphaerae bacterium]|nr:hypothetical protein [Phycisphaerae bacterium]